MRTPVTDRLVQVYWTVGAGPLGERLEEWTPSARRWRPGGDDRGNAHDRRRRKAWLLEAFGDGTLVACRHCWTSCDYAEVTADRIVPGHAGGRYIRSNLRPSCLRCAHSQGGTARWDLAEAEALLQ